MTLRLPPPLNRPLRVEPRDAGLALLDGDAVVCEVSPTEVELEAPAPISFEAALSSSERFDVEAYAAAHPFPTCFTCGPERELGDGLRLFPAPGPEPDVVVSPWIPSGSLPDGSATVPAAIVWAALDCPSGLAWMHGPDASPSVLGTMSAHVHRLPQVGEHLVVAGWRVGAEGRKLTAGSAIWTDDAELVAQNLATWVRLSPEQRAAFGTATP